MAPLQGLARSDRPPAATLCALCAAAIRDSGSDIPSQKEPVFLALGPKAAEMRQSPGDVVLAAISLLACSFTVLGYALSSFSTLPTTPLSLHTLCTLSTARGSRQASRGRTAS